MTRSRVSLTPASMVVVVPVWLTTGAGSSFDALFEYFLFTQPESVVIFECIERRPALLRAVGEHGDIWPALVPMFEAWGVPT